MAIKHAFSSAKSDGADATLVRPSDWNADHVGGPGSTLARLSVTSGDITLAISTTTMAEVSSALRLTVSAVAGDVLLIGLSTLLTQGGAGEAAIDSATIVSGSIVHQVSAGARGVGHGYTNAALRAIGATLTYVVVAGDISGGNVTVSPTFINTAASTGLLRASSTYALTYWVMNTGQ